MTERINYDAISRIYDNVRTADIDLITGEEFTNGLERLRKAMTDGPLFRQDAGISLVWLDRISGAI